MTYALPAGTVGRLLARRFVLAKLLRMFQYRHRASYEAFNRERAAATS